MEFAQWLYLYLLGNHCIVSDFLAIFYPNVDKNKCTYFEYTNSERMTLVGELNFSKKSYHNKNAILPPLVSV